MRSLESIYMRDDIRLGQVMMSPLSTREKGVEIFLHIQN